VPSSVFGHRILSDGLYTLAVRAFNIALMVALGVLTARLLGPGGKGLYAMPIVQAGLVATVFGGLNSATSYYLLNTRTGRRIVRPALLATACFVAAGAVAIIALAAIGHALWAAPFAMASLPAAAIVSVVTGYVVGVKRVRFATTLAAASTATTFALMAAGMFLVGRTPLVAILVWICSATLIAAVALVAMLLHARRLEAGEPVPLRTYFGMAMKVGATGLVSLLNYRADLYVVAVLLPPADLGLYTVAIAAAESLLVPTNVAALVTSPHIGGLERGAAALLAARCVRNNVLIATVVCTALFVFSPFIVGALYGAAFLPLVPALRILLVGVVALSLGGPVSNYYTLKLAKPEIPLVLAGASAAICLSTCIVLIPRLGIAGAALASTVAYVAGQGLGLYYFTRTTGITLRTMLVPTTGDWRTYFDFAGRIFRDGARLFAGGYR
jgi:O-antigen/teichoic acid export membrane protein